MSNSGGLWHIPGVGATPGVGGNPPAPGATSTPEMAALNKDNIASVLADARMGRYQALCCIADPNQRGYLDALLNKFGVGRTMMLLTQACCASPCSPLPQPSKTT